MSRLTLPGWPVYDDEQIEAVAAVLRRGRTNYWTGTECERFEQAFAAYCDVPHAIGVANGTVALELALIGLGVEAGADVIVPARSFIASASAVVARDAVPVFADVDEGSQTLTAETVEAALTPRTRAVVAVHLSGWPCDMAPILALAERHGLAVIEDCAQAHGAAIGARRVGSFGDAAAFSFCEDKIMSTGGEGGMLLVRDGGVWSRAWSYKDHGKPPGLQRTYGTAYRWVHETAGTNWRMNGVQAALGCVQLQRLDDWVSARQRNAARLWERLQTLAGLSCAPVPGHVHHARYRLALTLDPRRLREGWDRDRILAALVADGVPATSGVCPELYREKVMRRFAPAERLPVAVRLGDTSVNLPVHPTLGDEHIDAMAGAVHDCLSVAMR